jgi:hypothetical protein
VGREGDGGPRGEGSGRTGRQLACAKKKKKEAQLGRIKREGKKETGPLRIWRRKRKREKEKENQTYLWNNSNWKFEFGT